MLELCPQVLDITSTSSNKGLFSTDPWPLRDQHILNGEGTCETPKRCNESGPRDPGFGQTVARDPTFAPSLKEKGPTPKDRHKEYVPITLAPQKNIFSLCQETLDVLGLGYQKFRQKKISNQLT